MFKSILCTQNIFYNWRKMLVYLLNNLIETMLITFLFGIYLIFINFVISFFFFFAKCCCMTLGDTGLHIEQSIHEIEANRSIFTMKITNEWIIQINDRHTLCVIWFGFNSASTFCTHFHPHSNVVKNMWMKTNEWNCIV